MFWNESGWWPARCPKEFVIPYMYAQNNIWYGRWLLRVVSASAGVMEPNSLGSAAACICRVRKSYVRGYGAFTAIEEDIVAASSGNSNMPPPWDIGPWRLHYTPATWHEAMFLIAKSLLTEVLDLRQDEDFDPKRGEWRLFLSHDQDVDQAVSRAIDERFAAIDTKDHLERRSALWHAIGEVQPSGWGEVISQDALGELLLTYTQADWQGILARHESKLAFLGAMDATVEPALKREAILAWKRKYPERDAEFETLSSDELARAEEEQKNLRENRPRRFRPTEARNALWAEWKAKGKLTDAKIRDKWNAMSDEERIAKCPSGSNRLPSGDAGAKQVKEAIRSYKAQRKKDASSG